MKGCEKDLFIMARNGDIEAFEKLIEAYEKKIFSAALAVTGDRAVASELTQNIFVKVYKDIRNEESENRLSVLIYKVTHQILLSRCKNNLCIDSGRHRVDTLSF